MSKPNPITEYLRSIGAKGGESKSAAKRAAARANGLKPKKKRKPKD